MEDVCLRQGTNARNDKRAKNTRRRSPIRGRVRGRILSTYRILSRLEVRPRPSPRLQLTTASIRFINISLWQTFGSGDPTYLEVKAAA